MKHFLIWAILILWPLLSRAQNPEQHAQSRLESLIDYMGRQEQVPVDKLTELTSLLVVAEDRRKPRRERIVSWMKIHRYFFELSEDTDSTFQKRWLQFGAFPLFSTYYNHKLPDYQLTKSEATPEHSPGKIEKFGSGKETLILIPPAGFNASVYSRFIELKRKDYTIITITLPGFGGVLPYLRQNKRKLAEMPWFNHIENGLLNLMKNERLEEAFIGGNGLGGFIAIRFGLNHPDKVKGVVALNGLLTSNQSPMIPSNTLSPEERLARANTSFPKAEFIPYPVFQPHASFQSAFSINSEAIRDIQIKNEEETDIYAYRCYMEQMSVVNLADDIERLKVPLLSMTSVQDGLSPMVAFSRNNIIAWQKLSLKHHDKPIHLVPLKKTRNLILYDQPEAAGRIIDEFIKAPGDFGVPPRKRPTYEVNKSPRASVSQTFSNTDVSISYSRPAAKNRALFGGLIPYGKIWRAGANEGTEISFSRDTRVENRTIPKGQYTLFIKPEAEQWTIILNSILNQWNTSGYDHAYDVLQLEVPSVKATHQERLTYRFENITNESMDLVIHWGENKAIIRMGEAFEKPYAPEPVLKAPWKLLLTDTIADGQNPNSSDGKALYYHYNSQTDSLWFKLETHNPISTLDPALSISLDIDNDQTTGTNWYGSNKSFTVDLMLSAGPVRQGDGYAGYNGLTDATGIAKREWINVKKNNLTYYFDPGQHAYYLGIKRSDLGNHAKKINLIGSVGANSLWNDDIGKDGTFASIEVGK